MCNPRRIRVHATRDIADSWEAEVRRQVVRRGEATGEARVRESLSATLGAPTLAALAQVLGRTAGWERDGEGFRHALDGGYIRYLPGSRELEIVAQAVAEVEASGEASAVVRGELRDSLRAEGEGVHYDDNWGGITAADARRAAEQAAQRELDRQVEALLEAARDEADQARGAALDAAAASRADAELARRAAERGEALRRVAAGRLVSVGIQGRALFHQALADAYRDAILAYARARGAEGVVCREDGGVLRIEFEIQR